ncbi:MAG: hypothetical protein ACK5LK_10840, partial [Chthoniobacterales bacterium]
MRFQVPPNAVFSCHPQCDRLITFTGYKNDPFPYPPQRTKQSPDLIDFAKDDIAMPEARIFLWLGIVPECVIAQSSKSVTVDGCHIRVIRRLR